MLAETIEKIGNKEKVILVLVQEGSICTRVEDLVAQYSSLYESSGFDVFFIDVNEESQSFEETACARVPQIRIFVEGNLEKKIIGVLTGNELEDLVKQF